MVSNVGGGGPDGGLCGWWAVLVVHVSVCLSIKGIVLELQGNSR